MESKLPTDVSILSVGTGASVTPELRIPKKKNIKQPAMSRPRKDSIPNQDINRWITQQDPSLPPIIEKYTTEYKPLFNDMHDPNYTEDDPNDSTDNYCNENEDYVNKMKVNNNADKDNEYKDENSTALKND